MQEIEKYLHALPFDQRRELEKIRSVVKRLAPEAVELISYGMPGFKYNGKYLIAYGGFKDHLSIFPGSSPVGDIINKLSDFKLSKGTIQFTVEKPLPMDVLKEIIQLCIQRNGTS